MLDVVTIAGSPSAPSRSAQVLELARARLEAEGLRCSSVVVRDLDPADLVYARPDGPSVAEAIGLVQASRAVIIATPVYKAAYSGVLKAFLDLLPPGILADKPVLPITTSGSLAHCLALDYALKPVLSALGARHVLAGVCVLDSQMGWREDGSVTLHPEVDERLEAALAALRAAIPAPSAIRSKQLKTIA